MASRKEQKERLRAERVAKEEAERRDTSRRRRLQIGAALGALAIVVVVVVVIVLAGGGDGGTTTTTEGSKSSTLPVHADSVPADAQVGLLDSPPPWNPDYKQMSERISAMGLPGFNETISHTHAWLHIYVDGKKEPVPANVGIDPATNTISPLHTHDTSGIIHMESDRDYDFTLGQFMNVWGVKFSDSQIGSLKSKGDEKLQVFLNGEPVKDPVNVVMPEHGNVVIGYGKAGSFPTEPKLDWPAEL